MQSPEESSSINIINNLKILEKLANKDSIEADQLEYIYSLLVETTEWTYDTIISDEIEISLQILDLLYFLDRVVLAQKETRLRAAVRQPETELRDQLQYRLLLPDVICGDPACSRSARSPSSWRALWPSWCATSACLTTRTKTS